MRSPWKPAPVLLAARSRIHRRVLGSVPAAVTNHRTPLELGRLVGFDRHVDRLWQGRKTVA